MATQTQVATEATRDTVVEQKLQKLRELYADAPEVGKVALQHGMADIAREFAALKGATGLQSAGRVGSRQGKVSELTAILQIADGGAKRLRGLLELVEGNFRGADVVGTLHDMRFVFLDNDTKLLFAARTTASGTPTSTTSSPRFPRRWTSSFATSRGGRASAIRK